VKFHRIVSMQPLASVSTLLSVEVVCPAPPGVVVAFVVPSNGQVVVVVEPLPESLPEPPEQAIGVLTIATSPMTRPNRRAFPIVARSISGSCAV
jgi:hypothetical protein